MLILFCLVFSLIKLVCNRFLMIYYQFINVKKYVSITCIQKTEFSNLTVWTKGGGGRGCVGGGGDGGKGSYFLQVRSHPQENFAGAIFRIRKFCNFRRPE